MLLWWDCVDAQEVRSLRSLFLRCLRVRMQWWEQVRGHLESEQRTLLLCSIMFTGDAGRRKQTCESYPKSHRLSLPTLPPITVCTSTHTHICKYIHTPYCQEPWYICVYGVCVCIHMCTRIYTNKDACRGIDRTCRHV